MTSPRDLLRIGEVAKQVGLTVPTIRYYESRGLVAPTTRAGGKRYFDSSAVARLRAISVVQQAGFSLDEINELFNDEPSTADARRTLATAKLDEVRASIRQLERIAGMLEQGIACGCDSLEHCGLIALARPARTRPRAALQRSVRAG
jgi:MerR family redox-sensitive transcriptional activator SoxR